MRRRSPSYSPPRRGYGGRGRSPVQGRYGAPRDAPCGLLVRNLSKGSRPEDLRVHFERFGRVRDIYLPRDYYSGEPRGFGFVQYLDPYDAAEAKRYMDRQVVNGREITVVFAEENGKRPEEMRIKESTRGRTGYGGGRRSPYRGYSPAHSPRYRSPSPHDGRYSRSLDGYSRRDRYESMSPPPQVKHLNSDGRARRGRHSIPAERSYSSPSREATPAKQQSEFRSPSPLSPSHRSPRRDSRSRSRSWRQQSRSPAATAAVALPSYPSGGGSSSRRRRQASPSVSPRSRSPPPRRQRHGTSPNARRLPDPAQKTYSSLTPEEG